MINVHDIMCYDNKGQRYDHSDRMMDDIDRMIKLCGRSSMKTNIIIFCDGLMFDGWRT